MNLHTNEVRYFRGRFPVKELPEEEWPECRIVFPNIDSVNNQKNPPRRKINTRGYEDLSLHWGGGKVLLPTGLVWPRKLKSKK